MNWATAYSQLKAAVEATATVVANSIPVLDGAHAAIPIAQLAELREGAFQENHFSIVIEHPTASVMSQGRGHAFLRNAFSVIVVENPIEREKPDALNPLETVYAIATGILGRPGGPGNQSFECNEEFYRYLGDARGFLFHRFTFLITTTLPGSPQPISPTRIAI